MRYACARPKIECYIVDVRNSESICDAAAGSDYVFYTAALKRNSSGEFYPMEAVRTNDISAENALLAATKPTISKIVVLGADKDAYPIMQWK